MNCVIINHDLRKNFFEYNAWKTDSSFPILSEKEIDKIKNLQVVEFICKIKNKQENEYFFAKNLISFKLMLKGELFKTSMGYLFLFAIEHQIKNKSKIRSYKGLIDKKVVLKEDYVQKEIEFSNNQSVIAFIANLNQNNSESLMKFFFDDSTSFIIKSNNDYKNADFIDRLISLINISNAIEINYLKLIMDFCNQNDIIYRIGGDSGESYWSLQKFVKINTNG